MPILNLDKLKQKKAECSAAIVTAMKEQDESNKTDTRPHTKLLSLRRLESNYDFA